MQASTHNTKCSRAATVLHALHHQSTLLISNQEAGRHPAASGTHAHTHATHVRTDAHARAHMRAHTHTDISFTN